MLNLNRTPFSLFIVAVVLNLVDVISGSHFRGGTINWKPTGNGNEVLFNVKTGWTYSKCATKIGLSGPSVFLACQSGCTDTFDSAPNICLAADQQQDWSRAEFEVAHNFSSDVRVTVGYASAAWISALGGGSWNISTTLYVGSRSDTGELNNSPVAVSKPIYYIKYGCTGDIVIPVTDADGDNVRCRWSTKPECSSVCYSPSFLPNVDLDEETCTLRVEAKNSTGVYAVALTIEDRPRSTITIGTNTFTPNDVISSIPMQFIFITPDIPSRSCSDKPVFVTPTPLETDLLVCVAGSTISLPLYATSRNATITSFLVIDPPVGLTKSSIAIDANKDDVYFTTLTWTPTAEDQGTRELCVEATDNYLMSTQRCLTIKAWGIVDNKNLNKPVQDLGPCVSEPCFNNGTCTRVGVTEDFQCSCAPGYTSRQCHVDIDECASTPCQHGGTCVDQVNEYQCVCAPGYTGSECEIDIDECASNPCQNGATCFDLIDEWLCGCVDGYTGISCETDIDECASTPCQHGGTCVDQVNEYQCVCAPGYTGSDCEIDIDECASNPCQNGATCFDLIDEWFCGCVDGYTGISCETDIDECASTPCQHGGTCVDQVNEYQCVCAPGYTGSDCEIDIDECASNPCQNGATCFDLIDEWFCGCVDGYTGISCETDIDECASTPCQHGGTCVDQVNEYQCVCAPGYTGSDCEIDIDECASNPCQNGATCFDLIDEWLCGCVDGYTGISCETDIDECASTPCQHGGTCVDQVNEYQCVCAPGYTGSDCEIDIDECASNPCQNGATCFDLIDEWFCGCVDGYTGISCETDIDECYEQPCENGGTCRDMVGSYVCDCIQGTYGVICQNGIDLCLSLPCQNHGRCINTNDSTGYMCDCVDGWQGRHCAYKFENSSFGSNTGMVSNHMHYSDCNCKIGNDRNDLCYKYSIDKDAGFGMLGVFLGIITSVLFYIAYLCLFSRLDVDTDECDIENTAAESAIVSICSDTFNNKVHPEKGLNPEDGSIVVSDDAQTPVEMVEKKEGRPTRREHKCWACDVKKSLAPVPAFYRREHRHYRPSKPIKANQKKPNSG